MSASQKDEDLTENVLYRAIKLIPGLYDKPYNECLAAIKVSSMRYHRIQGDMILSVVRISLSAVCLRSTNAGQEVITLNFISHSFKLQYI